MTTLFHQSVIQFAPLRSFTRIDHTRASYAQLIRELFPKALFDEQNATYRIFMEIAWSFLSSADGVIEKNWYVQPLMHRIGGLPAEIDPNFLQCWYKVGKHHRDDKDPKTGFTLPAVIYKNGSQHWMKNGNRHRDDKDPQTGLTLPASICTNGSRYWYKDGKQHRDDKDPRTGFTLPAVIFKSGSQHWVKNGNRHRDDKDPRTGLTLPAVIRADGRHEWYNNGVKYYYPQDM